MQANHSTNQSNQDFFVVGIGASAGGLRALEEFFANVSTRSGVAFVVIQHLSPDFKSLMKELLERQTSMTIHRVTDGMELEANCVYLIPPGKNLVVEQSKLLLLERKEKINHEPNFPIDLFFQSLAKNYGERAIAVILSGSGSDGTDGLKEIYEAGGIVLVQEPSTAEFDGMPLSAIGTEMVNQVLPPREIAQFIYQYVAAPLDNEESNPEQNGLNSAVINYIAGILFKKEQINFSHYKVTTLSRRIRRRCLIGGYQNLSDYIQHLEKSSEERKTLCADLLISVTKFFRDAQAWENLKSKILLKLIEETAEGEELRFWVTACATGEEAYSLAIVIDEILSSLSKKLKIKIFATDVDKFALEKASQGIYPPNIVSQISLDRLNLYFINRDDSFQIVRRIREMLIFAPHDLTSDAGFTRMHLISCRNVLIYMQPNLQYQVLRHLHFSLISQGILFLGEAETLGDFEDEFTPLNKKWKIFQKRRDVRLTLPYPGVNKLERNFIAYQNKTQTKRTLEPILEQALKTVVNNSDSICLIVSKENQLLHVFGDANLFFKNPEGKVTHDVTKIIISPLQLPLNTALHRAKTENHLVFYKHIKLTIKEEIKTINMKVVYHKNNQQIDSFFVVTILWEATSSKPVLEGKQLEIENEAQERILALEYELQQTRENLQTLIEELETTNEEQQASNEELIASNEELQSTNEELHSVNEELHTVNVEYQSKIQELSELNNDINNLLRSTNIGVVFLDTNLRIRKFTPAATIAINLRDTDIGRPLEDLSNKIEQQNVLELLQQVQTQKEPIELEVKIKNKELYLLMRINLYQTEDRQEDGIVITFVKLEEIKKVQQELQKVLQELTQSNNLLTQEITQHQQTERLLQRQFRAIEAVSEGIAIFSCDRFIYSNQSYLELFGYSSTEELIDKSWLELCASEAIPFLEQQVLPLLQTQKYWRGETLGKHTNGEIFAGELSLTLTETDDLIIVCRNITERKQAEQALQQSETRYRAIVEDQTELICRYRPDSTVLFVNDAFCRYFGLERDGIINQSYAPVVYEADLERVNQLINSMNQDNPTVTIENRVWARGELRWTQWNNRMIFDQEGQLLEYQSVGRDITKLKQVEESLKENQERWQLAITSTGDGIWDWNVLTNEVYYSNRWKQIRGLTEVELSSDWLEWQKRIHPEDFEQFHQAINQHFTHRTPFSMQYRFLHHNGSYIWILDRGQAVWDDSGQVTRMVGAATDITEIKQAKEELFQINSELEQRVEERTQELEQAKQKAETANLAKDSFIAHMSHELKTPLNSILGFTQILKKDSEITTQQIQALKCIDRSGQHLLTLINDLLELSKIKAGKLTLENQEFIFTEFLDRIVEIIRLRAQQKDLTFDYQCNCYVPQIVRADETRLRQILLNLLGNAVKFTETGKLVFKVGYVRDFEPTIESELQSEIPNPETEPSFLLLNGKKVRFQIEDTGIGIASDKLTTVFLPFEQLNSNYEGTGLGLTISQNIAQLMNSELKVRSKENEGTIFWFDLDLPEITSLSQSTSINSNYQPTGYQGQRRKILIVDDNNNNRVLLIYLLQPLGFEIAEASNGREGLEIAQTFQPDLILLDLLMPVMDGVEMATQIKQQSNSNNTLIIFVSANIQSQEQLQSQQILCDGFLAKPVDLNQLLNLLADRLQIEWVYSNTTINNSVDLIIPPEPALSELLRLANLGDIDTLLEQIQAIEKLGEQYVGFTQELRQLAESFQQQQLLKFLKKILSSS